MKSKYNIVRYGFDAQTEVYCAYSFAEAVKMRDQLAAETGKYWRVFEDVDDLSESRFWSWLYKWYDKLDR